MSKRNYRYIYGPVPSWRLGSSLGIDPIARAKKACTFNCVYCQLGRAGCVTDERKVFVPTEKIVQELASLPPVRIDYVTFSGTGEPTLAKNLGELIRAVRGLRRERIAVLTNASLMHREDVAGDLALADLVVAKLDASSQDIFERINRPLSGCRIDTVIRAIQDFRGSFKGKLALQVMLMEENKACAPEIARIARQIGPDEVQLNTPLRPCGVKPLSRSAIAGIEEHFRGARTVSVYRAEKTDVKPISSAATLKRRGKV